MADQRLAAAWGPVARTGGVLIDLVMPASCGGCGAGGAGLLCPACRSGLAGLVPGAARPTPSPPGLPRCVALGGYDGPMRALLIAYKERGSFRLARPLGEGLARAVAALGGAVPTVLLPVPGTASANRARQGDHMVRLARAARAAIRVSGSAAVVVSALAARPKDDSSHLAAVDRLAQATGAFRARPTAIARVRTAVAAGARVIVVDDIMTTGATLAAATRALVAAGVPVEGAAVIAATRRRTSPSGS